MKERILFIKTPMGKYSSYSQPHDSSPKLDLLGILFSDEIRPGDRTDWITDPQIRDRAGNESYSFKEDNDIVVNIEYLDDEVPFRVNQDIFLKLVETWMNIYREFPDKIELTQEDDKFTFEFDTKDGHQKIVVE